MKGILISIVLLNSGIFNSLAQSSYTDSLQTHIKKYKTELLLVNNGPLDSTQAAATNFFTTDVSYRVVASFKKVKDKKGFTMLTKSNKLKHYYKYGKLTFTLKDTVCTLYIYQSKDLMQKQEYENYLFLPFFDATNYTLSYGGGRYLDFEISDIKNKQLIIDFNKCYNPYCAYVGGYNCPIPPKENTLPIAVLAGEAAYTHVVEE
jgi:uncharacterized protein